MTDVLLVFVVALVVGLGPVVALAWLTFAVSPWFVVGVLGWALGANSVMLVAAGRRG